MKYSIRICAVSILLLFILPIITILFGHVEYKSKENTLPELIVSDEESIEAPLSDTFITYPEVIYRKSITYSEALIYREKIITYISRLDDELLNGKYTIDAISSMTEELQRLQDILHKTLLDIERFERWINEYPVATEVWFYLREYGYSEEVTSGILGNMMAECGGITLNLDPNAYNPYENGGGLCGWLYQYFPEAENANLEEQCKILTDTIEKQFDIFSFCYYRGFSYEEFLRMTSVEDIALAFAKVYERCSSSSYALRQDCASVAYNYFTTN